MGGSARGSPEALGRVEAGIMPSSAVLKQSIWRRWRVRLGWWLVGRLPEAEFLLSWNPSEVQVRPLKLGIGSPYSLGLTWIEIPQDSETETEFFMTTSRPVG